MRFLIAGLIVFALALWSDSAFAQAKAGAKGSAKVSAEETVELGGVRYKKKTVYDFDDDVVEGDLMRPDGEYVALKRRAKHSSLIKIREHFIPEMLKSADDI